MVKIFDLSAPKIFNISAKTEVAQSTPATIDTNPVTTQFPKLLGQEIEGLLPGVRALRESIQVGSLEPEKEFLRQANERLKTPEGMADAAIGFVNIVGKPVTLASQRLLKKTGLADKAIELLTKAVKAALPLRDQIATAQSLERATRFAKAAEAQSAIGGQKGYFAGLSKLKGELLEKPPTFTPPSQSLTKESIDSLFSVVQDHPILNFGEKLTAQRGLAKLLDGHVPVPSELTAMEEVFGSDVIRAIYDKRPLSKKIWDLTGEILADVPRALKTTLDMSATLRQAIVLGVKHPIRFQQAFRESFKQMISKNSFEKALDTMKSTPEFLVAKAAGLHITDPRKLFGHREEYFLSNLAEKIPLVGRFVKASNRAYAGMLNTLRFNVFNDLAKSWTVVGQASQKNLKALADFINTGTGRGSLGKLERSATLLSRLFFAPRFVMSRVQFLNPVWYAKQPKPVRIEALKTFGTFVGAVGSVITLAKLGGADVELDWRSSNFGKMKVGNTYIDLTAGYGLYIRLFGQLITGEKKVLSTGKIEKFGGDKPYAETRLGTIERAARAKLAPLFSAAANLLEGKNVVGKEVTLKSELLEQVTPLYLGDLVDALKDRGPEALLMVGLPGFFGVGTQTFENQMKVKSLIPKTSKPKKVLSI